MARPEQQHSQQGFDRLLFFTDAVVAIAITLIVLPLVDSARDLQGQTATQFLSENGDGLRAAAISFVVIAAFWRDHHSLLENATGYTSHIVTVNLVWIAGVVTLPLATMIDVGAPPIDRVAVELYLATIALIMLAARVCEGLLARAGKLPGQTLNRRLVAESSVTLALMAVVLIIAPIFPSLGLLPALLLVLSSPLRRLVARRLDRADRARSTATT